MLFEMHTCTHRRDYSKMLQYDYLHGDHAGIATYYLFEIVTCGIPPMNGKRLVALDCRNHRLIRHALTLGMSCL